MATASEKKTSGWYEGVRENDGQQETMQKTLFCVKVPCPYLFHVLCFGVGTGIHWLRMLLYSWGRSWYGGWVGRTHLILQVGHELPPHALQAAPSKQTGDFVDELLSG